MCAEAPAPMGTMGTCPPPPPTFYPKVPPPHFTVTWLLLDV